MAAVVFFLSYKSSGYASDRIDFSFGRVPAIAALYGLIMFSFSALFSVPQVANNIENKNKVRVSIIFGIGANTLITIIFTVAALVSPGTVTKIATVGLSETLGMKIKAACSLFVLLAMLTSYWSIALAELDIIREQTKLGRKMCWLAATFPTLLMAIFLPGTYISLIQIVGGAVAVIAALLIIPSYYNAVRDSKDVLILGRIGKSRGLLCLVFILYILMAVSSFIEIN
jgi:hypothetical protein